MLPHVDVFAPVAPVRRIQAVAPLQRQLLRLHDLLQHRLRIIKELLGLRSYRLIIEDLRVASVRVPPPELPGLEEGVPVDERHDRREVLLDDAGAAWLNDPAVVPPLPDGFDFIAESPMVCSLPAG